MHKILVIEDQQDIRERNVQSLQSLISETEGLRESVTVVSVDQEMLEEMGERDEVDDHAISIEHTVGEYLYSDTDIRLVLVDRDLHNYDAKVRSESTITQGAAMASIPVCGYSRRSIANNPGAILSQLSSEVSYPLHLVDKSADELAKAVINIYKGFVEIDELYSRSEHQPDSHGRILAELLGKPEQGIYFDGYPNLIPKSSDLIKNETGEVPKRFVSYRLGLLLSKFILRFPGVIVDQHHLAAYLNLNIEDLVDNKALLDQFKYQGPFSEYFDYWWRYDIDNYMLSNDLEDGSALLLNLGDVGALSFSENSEEHVYCVVSGEVLPHSDSIALSLAPRGADLSRISRSLAEQWMVYLT